MINVKFRVRVGTGLVVVSCLALGFTSSPALYTFDICIVRIDAQNPWPQLSLRRAVL